MKPNILPFLAIVFATIFWIIDAMIDTYLFKEHESVMENIVFAEPVELWMRVLVVILFIVMAFIAKYLLKKEQKALRKLREYKENLEKMVDQRTQELQAEIETRKKIEDAMEKLLRLNEK